MVEAEGRASAAESARATARLSSPTRTRSRISRALLRRDLGGGGGSVTSWGVSGCSWARIGLKVTSKEGRSNSQKRPWRKARTLVSKASPAMSRGAPTRRPPNGFLEEEGLTGGFGGGVLVWRVWIEVRRRSRGRRWRIDSHLHLATPSLRTTSSMVRVIAWEIRFFCLGGSALAVGKGLRWRWSSLTPRECYGVRF